MSEPVDKPPVKKPKDYSNIRHEPIPEDDPIFTSGIIFVSPIRPTAKQETTESEEEEQP